MKNIILTKNINFESEMDAVNFFVSIVKQKLKVKSVFMKLKIYTLNQIIKFTDFHLFFFFTVPLFFQFCGFSALFLLQ